MKMTKLVSLAVLATLTCTSAFAAPANREQNIKRASEEARKEALRIEQNAAKGKSEAQIISELDRVLTEANIDVTRSDLNILDKSETLKQNKDKIELALAVSKIKQTTRGSYFAKSIIHLIKLANTTKDPVVLKDILSMLDNAIPFMGMEGAAAQKAQTTLAIYTYGISTGKSAVEKGTVLGNAKELDAQLSYKAAEAAIAYTFGKELKGADLKAKLDEFLKNCMKRG